MLLLGEPYGRLAVASLADDVVALLDEHFGEIEPDERLVFGDQHARALLRRTVLGHVTQLP
jgi:hypothetical protein